MPLQSYSLSGYGEMIVDEVRMRAYEEALAAACRPGCVVMDLGAGAGIMTLLACRLGARHVYAVDDSDAIFLAREIARDNGLSDRITFLHARSTEVSLSESVDVVVSDVRGVLPILGGSLKTLIDARRFLTPNGVLIPALDVVRCALVQHDAHYESLIRPWRRPAFGFDLSPAERSIMHSWQKMIAPAKAQLLTDPSDLIRLDYARLDSPNAAGSITTAVTAKGTAHGLCAWFDTRLMGDIGFSNEPSAPRAIYGQALFPLPDPVSVEVGDRVTISLRATLVDDSEYVWLWELAIRSAAGDVKSSVRQSTFFAPPFGAEALRGLDVEASPRLDVNGELVLFVLTRLNGGTTISSVATALRSHFPKRFVEPSSAISFVTGVARQYIAKPRLSGASE